MSDKEVILNRIIDIVAECCSYNIDGERTLTREQLLGSDKRENAVWSRCILVSQLKTMGFSTGTCSAILHRTEHAVRNMMENSRNLHDTSIAYRIAEAEVTLKCKTILTDIK